MTEKLATFRIDEEKWLAFKSLCKEQSSNASAVLLSCIQKCLDDGKIPELSHPLPQANRQANLDRNGESNLDERMEKLEAKLEAKLASRIDELKAELESELGKFVA